MTQIAAIVSAEIVTYRDNGQRVAYVEWRDDDTLWPKTSTTQGDPDNAHMQALLARARREGIAVVERTR